MSNKTITLTDKLYDYLLSVSLREPTVLQRLRAETAQLPMANMQIAPEQGQFMALLIQLMGAQKYLEIGVFTGYSTLAVALALPAEGRITACDVSAEWTAIAQRYWQEAGVTDKVTLHLAPALDTLERLIADHQAGSFDFAFIDADKENYLGYYERALTLLRPGGLIAVDNVLWSGQVADPNARDPSTTALKEFNQVLSQDQRITLSMLPLADGLTLARKN